MADYVEIANLAAQHLGEDDRISAPDEDTHIAASFAAAWPSSRRTVLRKHPWNFALKRWSLPSRVIPIGESIHPWAYAFPIPEHILRFHEVLDPHVCRDSFQREGQDILANDAGPLIIRGVVDVPETWQWADDFIEAFAFRLAFQCAMRVTGSQSIKVDCWAGYLKALRDAKSVDGRENPPIPASYEDSSWVTARYGL